MIDFNAMAMDSKSHSEYELRDGIDNGQSIWSFDSGTSGNDDILIYDPSQDEAEIMKELEAFFEIEGKSPFERDQPNCWMLTRMDIGEIEARYPLEG